jgi:hypothetical protein
MPATTPAMSAAAARSAAAWRRVRSLCVRSRCARCLCMRSRGTRSRGLGCARSTGTCRYSVTSAGSPAIAAIGRGARSTVITPSALAHKSMAAPSVAIAPAAPGSHAQKDAVVKIPRAVVAVGRAGVRRIAIIAVCAAWLNADVNHHLRLNRLCKSKTGEQCCCTE